MKPTDAEREAAFQLHLTRTANYHAEVVARGGTLWWLDPEKLAKLERLIPGISDMEPEQRRRALFSRPTSSDRIREASPA